MWLRCGEKLGQLLEVGRGQLADEVRDAKKVHPNASGWRKISYMNLIRPCPVLSRAPRRVELRPRRFLLIALFGVAMWLGSASASLAVLVTPTVTLNLGIYTYSYSVFNGGSNDLAIVSFAATPAAPFTVQNLTAPTGFISTFDSGNGLISFLEDNSSATPQTFAPSSTVSPFTFTSTFAPRSTVFEALDILGNTFTGSTLAPSARSVPESGPGIFGLCVLMALPGFSQLLRRRSSLQSATVS